MELKNDQGGFGLVIVMAGLIMRHICGDLTMAIMKLANIMQAEGMEAESAC